MTARLKGAPRMKFGSALPILWQGIRAILWGIVGALAGLVPLLFIPQDVCNVPDLVFNLGMLSAIILYGAVICSLKRCRLVAVAFGVNLIVIYAVSCYTGMVLERLQNYYGWDCDVLWLGFSALLGAGIYAVITIRYILRRPAL